MNKRELIEKAVVDFEVAMKKAKTGYWAAIEKAVVDFEGAMKEVKTLSNDKRRGQ